MPMARTTHGPKARRVRTAPLMLALVAGGVALPQVAVAAEAPESWIEVTEVRRGGEWSNVDLAYACQPVDGATRAKIDVVLTQPAWDGRIIVAPSWPAYADCTGEVVTQTVTAYVGNDRLTRGAPADVDAKITLGDTTAAEQRTQIVVK